MKAGLDVKISNYTLIALLAAVIVTLCLFFFVGFGEQVGVAKKAGELVAQEDIKPMMEQGEEFELNTEQTPKMLRSPEHADTLIYLMYVLTLLPVALICVYGVVNFVKKCIDAPVETLKGTIGLFLFVALCVGFYVIASSSADNAPGGEALLINGLPCDDYSSMVLTDFFLYVQYVLLVLSVVFTIISLSGVVKFLNKVKNA